MQVVRRWMKFPSLKCGSPGAAPVGGSDFKTLNLHEAAAFLHMHPEEVRKRAKRGLIPGAKAGRCWVFLETDLAEFVRRCIL